MLYRRLDIAAGFAAKNACSAVFVAGRSPGSARAGENSAAPVRYARLVVDREAASVTASFYGFRRRTAVYREGLGCVLLPPGVPPAAAAGALRPARRRYAGPALPWPPGQAAPGEAAGDAAALAAIDAAFDAPGEWKQKTAAVIVLSGDRIAAERYAPGFGPGTRLAGWSMTKSLTGAVAGALAGTGRLSVSQKNLFPVWSDGRREISLGHLLNMNSGLAWTEDYGTVSDVTRMLFLAGDTGAAQLGKELVAAPGVKWRYSSGTTNLLSAFLRRQFPSDQAYLDFWYAALADRIGMESLQLETDLAGNYVGSSYAWATARDWAKFGLLLLRRGNWKGDQVLPAAWVDFLAAPAAGSAGRYGAHFWLNAGGKYPAAPRDMFYCDGFQGQHIFIVPSRDLVLVRLGLAGAPAFDAGVFLERTLAAFAPAAPRPGGR